MRRNELCNIHGWMWSWRERISALLFEVWGLLKFLWWTCNPHAVKASLIAEGEIFYVTFTNLPELVLHSQRLIDHLLGTTNRREAGPPIISFLNYRTMGKKKKTWGEKKRKLNAGKITASKWGNSHSGFCNLNIYSFEYIKIWGESRYLITG